MFTAQKLGRRSLNACGGEYHVRLLLQQHYAKRSRLRKKQNTYLLFVSEQFHDFRLLAF